MSHIRTIKPGFFRSRSLARCSLGARMTFAGLWCEADDHGRGIADARLIKGSIWPLDDDVDAVAVASHLAELETSGHIRTYTHGADEFFAIHNWENHQSSAYRRGDPVHPAPPTYLEDQTLHAEVCMEAPDARQDVLEGKGRERKGKEVRKGSAPLASFEHEFAEVWKIYPRTVDRSKAMRAYTARRKAGVAADDLMRAATNYAASVIGGDSKFVKHGATFFGPDEPWREYLSPTREQTAAMVCVEPAGIPRWD